MQIVKRLVKGIHFLTLKLVDVQLVQNRQIITLAIFYQLLKQVYVIQICLKEYLFDSLYLASFEAFEPSVLDSVQLAFVYKKRSLNLPLEELSMH